MTTQRTYVRRQLGSIERDILSELTAGDLLVGMLLSGRSSRTMFKVARERARRRQATQRALERLSHKGLITIDGEVLHLTGAGQTALDRVVSQMRSNIELKRTVWDGTWRVVAFDIPEKWRVARNALRLVLKRAGFLQLQQSVWAHPHDCGELELLLAKDERLAGRVLYAMVEKFTDERALLHHFKLHKKERV